MASLQPDPIHEQITFQVQLCEDTTLGSSSASLCTTHASYCSSLFHNAQDNWAASHIEEGQFFFSSSLQSPLSSRKKHQCLMFPLPRLHVPMTRIHWTPQVPVKWNSRDTVCPQLGTSCLPSGEFRPEFLSVPTLPVT